MPPYLVNTSMKCQACQMQVSTDIDPTAGKYVVSIVFGNNYDRESGVFSERYIAGYKVHLVDEFGRRAVDTMAEVNASDQTNTCCNGDAYVVTVSGDFSTNIENGAGGYFMVVPYTMVMVGNVNTKVPLPLGTMTSKVVDLTTGTATKIKQDLKMVMSEEDAQKMATDSSYDPVIIKSIIRALNNPAYKDEFFTIIEKFVANVTARRLDNNGRRLVAHATHELKVTYEALLPSDVPEITTDMINTTVLKEAVNDESTKAGIPVEVASATAESVEVVGQIGGTGSQSTDGARRLAGSILASFAAVLLTLAGQLTLA
jgi:hypothetical protein